MKRKLLIWAAILAPPTAAVITLLAFPLTREVGVILLIPFAILAGIASFSWGMSHLGEL